MFNPILDKLTSLINVNLFFHEGRDTQRGRNISRLSSAAEVDELITPSVDIRYTKNLINGKFVDAASGKCDLIVYTNTSNVIYSVV